jgi:purine-nucleoside phosphorylase
MRFSALILTCAAGGIQTDMCPGDIVIIKDHINMMGTNPLIGPHDPILGPRFPDMSTAYDELLRRQLADAASEAGVPTRSGIYAALSGPSYETPAEISALRNAGADLVGMSTVPETLVARAMGIRVLAIACVTNLAAGMAPRPLDHAEVLTTTQASSTRIQKLLEHFLTKAQTQLRRLSD